MPVVRVITCTDYWEDIEGFRKHDCSYGVKEKKGTTFHR